jgi:superfamily II DNA or RNA helicase
MEIQFDNGTIVAKLPSDWRQNQILTELLRNSAYWRWDPRVQKFRAPAQKLYSFLAELKSLKLNFNESITQKHGPLAMKIPSLEMRPYQVEAFTQWDQQGRRGVVILPTGSGKTRLALYTILKLKAKTLILVPTRVLLHQWREEISTRFQFGVGILGDGQWQINDVTVATYESAIRAAGNIGDLFTLVVIDEAHHFLSGERIEIIEMLCAPYCLSLSATFSYQPLLSEKITSLLGPIAFELSIDDLKGSVLAPFQKFLLLVNLSVVERKTYDGLLSKFHEVISAIKSENPDLNSKEVFQLLGRSGTGKKALANLRKARTIISQCDEKLSKLYELLSRFPNRKILIFTENTEVALRISSQMLIFPILAETAKSERKKGIDLFVGGALSVLVTCRVLNEGFDVPEADMAIILGGAHGEREHIQRIGRVLRSAPGKSALIYELVCRETIEVRQWRKRNSHE